MPPSGLNCARVGLAQQGLELGEDLLDRIEIGRVARQEEQLGAGAADQAAHRLALVTAEIARLRLRLQKPFPPPSATG